MFPNFVLRSFHIVILTNVIMTFNVVMADDGWSCIKS